MLPTPCTAHVNFDQVYEPAEDSYLLLDVLSSAGERAFLHKRFGLESVNFSNGSSSDLEGHARIATPLAHEVGVGSGVVLAFLAAHVKFIFGREDVLFSASDLSKIACQASQQTVNKACQSIVEAGTDVANRRPRATSLLTGKFQADLTSNLRSKSVDILVFNPPYVPSPGVACVSDWAESRSPKSKNAEEVKMGTQLDTFEQDDRLLALSYEGGFEGMEVTNRFLEDLPRVLNEKRGVAYLLLCQQNRPELVIQRIHAWSGNWSATIIGRSGKHAGWEKLVILRIVPNMFDKQ